MMPPTSGPRASPWGLLLSPRRSATHLHVFTCADLWGQSTANGTVEAACEGNRRTTTVALGAAVVSPTSEGGTGGGDPSVLDANYPPN